MTANGETTGDAMSCVNEPADVTSMPARSFFMDLKRYQADICSELHQQSAIFPCTTRYQRQTIKWMTHQEKRNRAVKSDGSPFTGGVLADETYAGKIVEVLGCVVENPASYEFRHQKIVLTTGDRLALSPTGETDNGGVDVSKGRAAVSDVSRETIVVKCPCAETPTDGTLVMCAVCGNGQHAQCVRFQHNRVRLDAYLCEDCWSVNDRFQCNATLIVVPHSTLDEWTDKTTMAKLGLKSFVYRGISYDGYVQPHFFNDYDVVVTSYNYLRMDVNYSKNELYDETTRPRLRHARKYTYSRSPLRLIKWWRICFDCNQEINCYVCNKSKITACLKSVHKWVINGTPIRTSLDNLFCIIRFLDIKPYCDHNKFLMLIKGEQNHMYSWFANVIRHNFLDDINMELKIPKLTNAQHWLKYSQLERQFYPKRYKCNVKRICVNATKPCQRLNTPLKHVNWKKLLPIIIPIVQFQNECQYPQFRRREFMKLKKLSMTKIIDEKILQSNNNETELLRCILLQHNVIAGLYFVVFPNDAMRHYNTVLQLAEKYQHNISDIHQSLILHAMNMIILVHHNTNIHFSSSIHKLRYDIKQRTDKYMLPYSIETKKIQGENAHCTFRIHMLMKGKRFSTDWYNNMFELIVIPRHFFYELQLELADYCVNGVTNIAKKLETKHDISKILQKWLTDLGDQRTGILELFEILNNLSTNELYYSTYTCCTGVKQNNKPRPQLSIPQCKLCKTEIGLKEYEVVLFNYSYIGATEDSIWTNTYEKSQEELLLSKLFNYGKSKITDPAWLENATNHMKTISLLHTEFKGLKKLWCQRNKTNYQYHNLEMSKSKFVLGMELYRSRDIVEPKIRVYGQKNNNNYVDENIYNTIVHLQNGDLDNLLTENSTFYGLLDSEVRFKTFLQNLKIDSINGTLTVCLICYNNVDCGWAVLLCGHSICVFCTAKLSTFDSSTITLWINCPFCNVPYEISESTTFFTENREETQVSGVTFKGNFSIKMESITLKLMELIAENPNVKVLILSLWDKALDLLGETLELNTISFRMMKPGGNFHATLNEFKTDSKINALLMTLSLIPKEFHLTEATRIFFMEPVINKAYEIKAIGKIRRIGQTKPTFVHHFIIRDTIEEKITNVFSKRSLDDWGDVTVSQLANILKK